MLETVLHPFCKIKLFFRKLQMFQYFEILSKSDHLEMEQNLLHSIIKITFKLKYLMKEKNLDRVICLGTFSEFAI